jgi:hypothetical protein
MKNGGRSSPLIANRLSYLGFALGSNCSLASIAALRLNSSS